MKKYVIFDLDGTLVDTIPGLMVSINKLMEEYNYPYRYNYEDVKTLINGGAIAFYLKAIHQSEFKEENKAEFEEFLKLYKEYQVLAKPFKDVVKVLKKLEKLGISLMIYTNKPHEITLALVNLLFSDIKFDFVHGNIPGDVPKPDITLMQNYLDEHNLSNLEGLYVGDSIVDILTAHNLKMDMLFCKYGYSAKEYLNRDDVIYIDEFSEVLNYIK